MARVFTTSGGFMMGNDKSSLNTFSMNPPSAYKSYGYSDGDMDADQAEALKKVFEGNLYREQKHISISGDEITNRTILTCKIRRETVDLFLQQLSDVRLFIGGSDEDYGNVKALAGEWIDKAICEKYITQGLPILRVKRKALENNLNDITLTEQYRKATSFIAHNINLISYALVKDAMREYEKGVNGLAGIEYRILLLGGLLIGNDKNNFILYYDNIADIVMEKLMEEDGDDSEDKYFSSSVPNSLMNQIRQLSSSNNGSTPWQGLAHNLMVENNIKINQSGVTGTMNQTI